MLKETKLFKRLRQEMVERQIKAKGITDKKVLRAMETVPRQMFVSEALENQAYGDHPLPISEGQTISQPLIVAEMTQALELTGGERVLEIGTGSGYQTAILSKIVFRVYTMERMHGLLINARKTFDKMGYHNIISRYADGASGWPDESPFDAIIVTAGAPDIPEPLVRQLAVGGRLVIPVGDRNSQELTRLVKNEDGVCETKLGKCRFVRLISEHGWPD